MSETNQKFLSDRLAEEYKRQQALFSAQPAIVQRFLETQGKQIAEAVVEGEFAGSFFTSRPNRLHTGKRGPACAGNHPAKSTRAFGG